MGPRSMHELHWPEKAFSQEGEVVCIVISTAPSVKMCSLGRMGSLRGPSRLRTNEVFNEREMVMDSVTVIRVVAAVLFVVILGVLIQRRRSRVK